jgi:hypothetical protein
MRSPALSVDEMGRRRHVCALDGHVLVKGDVTADAVEILKRYAPHLLA